MNTGDIFDFVLLVKNDSNVALNGVNLQIKVPSDILYSGFLGINGKIKKQDITNSVAIGVFLPGEQKTINFKVRSEHLSSKESDTEISALVYSGAEIASDSTQIVLKPYTFQGIKIAKNVGLATAGLSAKKWYFWAALLIILLIYSFRLFLYFFSTPRG